MEIEKADTASDDDNRAFDPEVISQLLDVQLLVRPPPPTSPQTDMDTLGNLRNSNRDKFDGIHDDFLQHFKIPSDCRLSESITTQAHLKFINERI